MKDKELLKNKKKLLPGSGLSYHKFKKPDWRILQTFKYPGIKNKTPQYISFISNEISALCPLTKQPDWYKINISYIPEASCIESKSAKLYLGAYRDYPGFIETLCEVVFHDWRLACLPKFLRIELEMAPRGGIAIKTVKEQTFLI